MNTATEPQKEQFEQLGYVVVPGAIDSSLLESLVGAIDRLLDRAAAGEFGSSFRWMDQEKRIPEVISDLLGPQKFDPAFGQFFDEITLPFVESLLQKPVRCSWLSLFTSGAGNHYSTPLHRDNNAIGGTEEAALLERFRMRQCSFQAPILAEDTFLQVVPGSHLRPATDAEVAASDCDFLGEDVPGLETIALQPGDIVYRHTDTVHRGWNPKGKPRWTLISSLWAASVPMLEIERQDQALLGQPVFLDELPPRLRVSAERYLEAFQSAT